MLDDIFYEPPQEPIRFYFDRYRASKLTDFLHCRKYYYWCYELGLVPKKVSQALQIGDVVHRIFHRLYENDPPDWGNLNAWVKELHPADTDEEAIIVAVKALELVEGYLEYWKPDKLELVSSEFYVSKQYDDYELYCRVDGLVRTEDSRLWRLERKTTSYNDSAFLAGLRNSLQTGLYHKLLLDCLEEKIAGTIYDLLVKTKVPQYERNPVPISRVVMDRCIKTIEGCVRSIRRGDFYPSNQCFTYNRECEYIHLCNFDSEETRKAFYNVIPEEERR